MLTIVAEGPWPLHSFQQLLLKRDTEVSASSRRRKLEKSVDEVVQGLLWEGRSRNWRWLQALSSYR